MVDNGVEDVGEEEFEKAIHESLCVVDFYADWCMPCIMLSPVIEDLHNKIKDVKFIKINIDENRELASKFNVMSIPCLIFFKEGKEVNRIVGGVSSDVIEEKINSLK